MHHYYDVHAYRLCHACTKFYDRKHLAMGVGEQQDHKTPDQWWWVRGDRSWKFEPQSAHRGSWDDPSEWWRLPGPHACSEIFSLDTCSIFLIMQIWSLGQWHICMQDSSASMFDRPQDALAAGSGGGEPPVTPLPNVSTLVIKVHACMRGMFYMYMMHACFFLL